jgi:L-ascorbate metabolism protein UlaG (beta-lactamase superfamily)
VGVTLVGGPTPVIEIGGLRLLTDPTFDPPGPALPVEAVGRIDAVPLSHDQHPDNLDRGGRHLLTTVPVTITTPSAAAQLDVSTVPALPLAVHHADPSGRRGSAR